MIAGNSRGTSLSSDIVYRHQESNGRVDGHHERTGSDEELAESIFQQLFYEKTKQDNVGLHLLIFISQTSSYDEPHLMMDI